MKKLNQKIIKKILSYNKETGEFNWKKREVCEIFPNSRSVNVFNSKFSGFSAGSILTSKKSKTSYVAIKILGKSYKAHRLAFLYVCGFMPEQVDHIDKNGLNNKWSNLRASNNKDNSKNMPMQKSNKTGVIGVNWHKAAKKWQVRAVNKDGVRVDLGRYSDFEKAVYVRKKYEKEYGYYQFRDKL